MSQDPAAHRSALLDELSRLDEAEDFFEYFDLAFDPVLLRINRLSMLKRFRLEMQAADREAPEVDEATRRTRYREALRRAHDSFREASALEQKLFRALAPDETPLVSLGRPDRP